MDNHTETAGAAALDHGLIERELVSLNALLGRPITPRVLKQWVRDVAIRDTIIGNSLWGTIQWRKSIGQPISALFANAFVIERTAWHTELDYEGGVHEVTVIAPQPSPSKWDGPHDDEFFRVSFLASMLPLPTRVQVTLAPGIAWTRPPAALVGYREIDPAARSFDHRTGWLVLEPFEVVRKPWALHT